MVAMTDEPLTKDDLATALAHMNAHAKRQQHHLDCAAWNRAHAKLDDLLTAHAAAEG